MSRFNHIYNHKKDVLDGTEMKFSIQHHKLSVAALPSIIDLRSNSLVPEILDQGQLGSCGPNEISNAIRFNMNTENKTTQNSWQPSRLYIYYFTRLYEGSILSQDTGISILGGLRAVQKYGVCNETIWPYNIASFTQRPSSTAIKAAHTHCRGFNFLSVPQDLISLKQVIAGGGSVIVGIQVYDSLESETTTRSGNVPIPNTGVERHLGGHCVGLYGYDDSTQTFLMMNSWGKHVGQQGWFRISYNYILDPNLSSDFWTITHFT